MFLLDFSCVSICFVYVFVFLCGTFLCRVSSFDFSRSESRSVDLSHSQEIHFVDLDLSDDGSDFTPRLSPRVRLQMAKRSANKLHREMMR